MASEKEGEKIEKNFRAPQALNHREIYFSKVITEKVGVSSFANNGDNKWLQAIKLLELHLQEEKNLSNPWTA